MINCSVTVMPILNDQAIGFIRRAPTDSFPNKLVAPGGVIEFDDGELIDKVRYWAAEYAAIRELKEETNIEAHVSNLMYFCSLVLPKLERVVLSYYCMIESEDVPEGSKIEFLTFNEIKNMTDDEFAPGMRKEALLLIEREYQ